MARKDFSHVVEQARSEIGKIATEVSGAVDASSTPRPRESVSETTSTNVKGKGIAEPVEDDITNVPAHSPSPPASPIDSNMSTSIFARLQAQLPPNLQPAALSSALSTARATSASSLSSVNAELAYIRSALASNIQLAQSNLNVAQAEKLAEGYLSKSAELFTQAGEFLKDAVKVVPPSAGDGGEIPIVSGADVWLFPSPIGTPGWGGSRAVDDDNKNAASRDRDASLQTRFGHATRSEALLRRLKYDPDMLRLDPSQDESISANFAVFARNVEEKGGVTGETFVNKISQELAAGLSGRLNADATALIDTRDALGLWSRSHFKVEIHHVCTSFLVVPAEMGNDTFWTRYFFRVHQITHEEEKRKALLAGTATSLVRPPILLFIYLLF